MDALLWLITEVVRPFLEIFPRAYKIQANEKGIMFWRKNTIKILEPWVHWFIPLLHSMASNNIAYRNLNLNRQTLTTKDWKAVLVEPSVFFKIVDIKKAIVDNGNIGEIIASEIASTIKDYIVNNTLKDSVDNMHTIIDKDSEVVILLQESMGIQIDKIKIINIATCVHLNNINNVIYTKTV